MKWVAPGLLVATLCVATSIPGHTEDAMLVNPNQMKWAALDLIPGTEIAVLSGDLGKPGLFVMEWRGPAGAKAAPHWHTNTERVTLLSGNGMVGMGDSIDPQKGMPLVPGGYGEMPAKMHHWFVAQSPFVMLIEGDGPFDVNFVNPEDDPTKKTSR